VAVINHVHLMVGNANREIEDFKFLADDAPEQNPSLDFFRLIVWLCDYPKGLRRNRAAAMLLWLVELVPDLLSVAATTAISMEQGYGPDMLCGVLDGASAREPLTLWD